MLGGSPSSPTRVPAPRSPSPATCSTAGHSCKPNVPATASPGDSQPATNNPDPDVPPGTALLCHFPAPNPIPELSAAGRDGVPMWKWGSESQDEAGKTALQGQVTPPWQCPASTASSSYLLQAAQRCGYPSEAGSKATRGGFGSTSTAFIPTSLHKIKRRGGAEMQEIPYTEAVGSQRIRRAQLCCPSATPPRTCPCKMYTRGFKPQMHEVL